MAVAYSRGAESFGSFAAAPRSTMPTLLRFLTVVAVIGGLVYGGIFALATFFDPEPREITVTVPQDKFQKR
jgi:hypothetical protein